MLFQWELSHRIEPDAVIFFATNVFLYLLHDGYISYVLHIKWRLSPLFGTPSNLLIVFWRSFCKISPLPLQYIHTPCMSVALSLGKFTLQKWVLFVYTLHSIKCQVIFQAESQSSGPYIPSQCSQCTRSDGWTLMSSSLIFSIVNPRADSLVIVEITSRAGLLWFSSQEGQIISSSSKCWGRYWDSSQVFILWVQGEKRRGLKLTTCSHLVGKARMSGAVPPILHMCAWRGS